MRRRRATSCGATNISLQCHYQETEYKSEQMEIVLSYVSNICLDEWRQGRFSRLSENLNANCENGKRALVHVQT